MTAADGNVMYKLEKGYQITRVLGKECLMILRDKYSTPLATIELCRGKISSVTPYRGAENDRNHIRVIQRFGPPLSLQSDGRGRAESEP